MQIIPITNNFLQHMLPFYCYQITSLVRIPSNGNDAQKWIHNCRIINLNFSPQQIE